MLNSLLVLLYFSSVNCPYTENPPIIDGKIEEDCWNNALVVENFKTNHPFPRQDPKFKTIVYLCYNKKYLFIGIKNFTTEKKFRTKVIKRDGGIGGDECIYILVRPDIKREIGYCFGINAINIQEDFLITENGNSTSYDFDIRWKSSASKTDYGWSAETEIPLYKLNIQSQIIGIRIIRVTFSNNEALEFIWGSEKYEKDLQINDLAEVKLEGPNISNKNMNIKLTPFGLGEYKKEEDSGNYKYSFDGGMDGQIKYKNLKDEFTINPDYAQLEADQAQINLYGTQLYLDEKRNFFKEDIDFFSNPINLFYSRSIKDFDAGNKIRWDYKGFGLGSYLIKGKDQNTYYNIDRFTQNVYKDSYLYFDGIFAEQNDTINDKTLSFQTLLYTLSDIKAKTQLAYDFQDEKKAYYLSLYRYPLRGLCFTLSREYIDKDFDPSIGFITYNDIVSYYYYLAYITRFDKGLVKSIVPSASYCHDENTNGGLLADSENAGMTFGIRGGFTLSASYGIAHRYHQDVYYDNKLTYLYGGYSFSQGSISSSYTFGDNLGAREDMISFATTVYPFTIMYFSVSADYLIMDYDTTKTKTLIFTLKDRINLLSFLAIVSFFQWDDTSKLMQVNELLDFQFKEFSHLYIALNTTFSTEGKTRLIDKIALCKLCYQFDF